jgi:phosphatidylglycerol lysyltransferase
MIERLFALAQRHQRALSIGLVVTVAVLGFLALSTLLHEVQPGAVRAAFHALSPGGIAASMLLTVASYLLLTLYDVLALRTIGRPLPWRTAAFASFASYTLSHNLGLSLLTGGSARLRIYGRAGVSAGDVSAVILIAGFTFWSGVFCLAAIGLIGISHPVYFGQFAVFPGAARAIGLLILAGIAALLFAAGRQGRKLTFGRWTLPLPSAGAGVAMLGVGALDLIAASAALFALLPHASLSLYPLLLLAYAVAVVVGLISHVPGGLGIFEAVVLATVPGPRAPLLAALLAYRVIYYLLPLCLALAMVAAGEARSWRQPVARALSSGGSLAREAAPTLSAILVFTGGVILLLSDALPAIPARLRLLHAIVPLPFSEASHIAASLSGTLLLFLAPGLWRRLDGAYYATRLVLIAGMTFSIVKGLDYEEAVLLGCIGVFLRWAKPAFYRRTAMLSEPLSPRWISAALIAVASSLFVGAFAFKHVDWQDGQWWQLLTERGDAARFLRGSVAVAVALAIGGLWRLMAPARPLQPDTEIDPTLFERSLERATSTDAFLALTGDKQMLAAPEGDAFIMYRVQGSNWIVMGDPVGNPERWGALLWQLRERADIKQGRLLLYQITEAMLPHAIELGLEIVKCGEEGRVDVARFSMSGKDAKPLRYAERRATADGATFDVIAAEDVAANMAQLRAVSDEWLASRQGREKGFSLGRFDEEYLARFPVAVVRINGRIVAFANILALPNHDELSVDLMRHADVTPYGTMDFLFIRLIGLAREWGYRWFNMGIAPLAGLSRHRLAPRWSQIGGLLFRHGEALYGFRGLRSYKAKFATDWRPRYIAGPRGFGFARALAGVFELISKARPAPQTAPTTTARRPAFAIRLPLSA